MKELKTVMLVDDDETTNFLNKYFVSQLDSRINIVTVHNGQEALDFIAETKINKLGPCLLILDTNMPVMDGWGFLENYEKLFDDTVKSQITVVMVTALESDDVIQQAMEKPNVVDTVQKPMSDIKFRMLIKKHFMEFQPNN